MNVQQIRETMESSLTQGIRQGIFPGGAVSLLRNGSSAVTVCMGKTSYGHDGRPVHSQTLYDMASLTKVMVALPLILISVQEGKLSLTDSVTNYLPELASAHDQERKGQIKIIHLLTHTSGLPAWRPYFLLGKNREEYLRLIANESMLDAPGRNIVYSDLGFMLLGFLLEHIWDEELDALAKRLIFQPSGMIHTSYLPLEQTSLQGLDIAATEKGNAFEQNMAVTYLSELTEARHPLALEWQQALAGYGWREGVICGTVHDCNANYGLRGVSGHAGLFSTLADTERYMHIWTSGKAPVQLDSTLCALATRSLTDHSIHRRGLGWIISPTGGSLDQLAAGCSGGDLVSEGAFGHTGFTGTSIWSDPARDVTLITLTNRVHPVASPLIGAWRTAHHNRIFSISNPDRTS
ncbi:serine hydrolase domain-containing protein [Brevibacillus fortis]|uniref:Serine hydrolase n=1 Tax=Brevibacillus fortis TaxID=2126352 RepID=A0A2P7V5U0_9BACL|nr:serine hydrolase domain-containing protein [Brevibacillus fortis]PSJ94582.1 serine hydrolase [Brevibacillus fortis]